MVLRGCLCQHVPAPFCDTPPNSFKRSWQGFAHLLADSPPEMTKKMIFNRIPGGKGRVEQGFSRDTEVLLPIYPNSGCPGGRSSPPLVSGRRGVPYTWALGLRRGALLSSRTHRPLSAVSRAPRALSVTSEPLRDPPLPPQESTEENGGFRLRAPFWFHAGVGVKASLCIQCSKNKSQAQGDLLVRLQTHPFPTVFFNQINSQKHPDGKPPANFLRVNSMGTLFR